MRALRVPERIAVVVVAGGVLAVVASSLVSCGGDDTACGDVSCVAPRTVVKWEFNADAVPGFTFDGCIDVGASQVEVSLTGGGLVMPDVRRGNCADRQIAFSDLAAGQYTATVTPLDSAGASLVTVAPTATFAANTVPGTTEEHVVIVPPAAWSRPMTGTFFFMLRWAGMRCPDAAPPVTTQLVTLTLAGGPTSQQANVNSQTFPVYRLDGTQPVGCVPSEVSQAEAAPMVPFGPATITVSGRDTAGVEWFRGSFDTFVGAGTSNPILTFDVQSTVDAGIDAPTDAPDDAPVDAGVDAPDDAPVDAPPDA